MKSLSHVWLFMTAALFTIAKIWKQPKYLWTDKWIKKCVYTIEYYSAIKKSEIMLFAATWLDLEIIILSEVSQTEKDKFLMISLKCRIWNMTQMNLFTKEKQTHRHRKQTFGYQSGKRVGRDKLEIYEEQIQATLCMKYINTKSYCIT